MIPLSAPSIGTLELDYVKAAIESGWVSSVGSYVDTFEQHLAELNNTKYAVATTSGTAALHLALLASGVGPDDEVIVSNLTFIAPVNAIQYVGAHPVLVDAESRYWQMDMDLVERFLENDCDVKGDELVNRGTGRRVQALLPVHILGHPADMTRAADLAKRFKLVLIEDASESLGARFDGRPVGGIGDAGCFSFNGNKLMTTGGGGMLVSNNSGLSERARYLSTQAKDDPIEYVHKDVGYNYRLTNIQAAMGVAQCERLEQFLMLKKEIAERYRRALSEISGITLHEEAKNVESSWWLYTILVDPEVFGMDSRSMLKQLQERNIQSRPLWQPQHLNAPYAGAQRLGGEVSEDLYRRALSIPCSVDLAEEDQNRVIEAIQELSRQGERVLK